MTLIFNYFKIAAKATTKGKDNRAFLVGAAAVRKDGTIVKAFNGSSRYPSRTAHAEYRLASKLDVGAVVYATLELPLLSVNTTLIGIAETLARSVSPLPTV